MKILRNIVIVLAVLIALCGAVGFFLPASVHVERATAIDAPPQAVFEILNSFKRFNEWSPWYEYDPGARYTYSGPAEGVGAKLEWVSNKPEVGSGWQEIVASESGKRVGFHMDFGDQGTAEGYYELAAEGTGTRMTWGFDTSFGHNLVKRYFGLVLDSMVGKDFEKGLAKLKTVAEGDDDRSAPAAPAQPTVEEVSSLELVSVEGISSLDPAAMAQSLQDAYGKINAFLAAHGLQQSGAVLAITRFYDESGWGFEAAIPFAGTPEAKARAAKAAKDGIKVGPSYAGRAIKGVHIGSYTTLPETYQQLEDYAAEKGLDANGRPWEQYVSDPRSTPEAELRTEVYMPVKSIE